jgi:hypothetical protein
MFCDEDSSVSATYAVVTGSAGVEAIVVED